MYDRAQIIDTPPTSAPVTEDFLYTDRRSGGANYGSLDASGWQKLITETWRVGSSRPSFAVVDVVAVRGEWSAAVVELTDFGDDATMEFITCFQLDADSRLVRRHVNFDLDDRDAAVAELDRMYAEIADEAETHP
jgi:hypothetical protein